MRKILIGPLLFLQTISLSAQKFEQGFDYSFKPTGYAPLYYVVTGKKDTLWHREAYYLPERSQAMEGWYKDKDCKIEQGMFSWYHPNKVLKSIGTNVNGKKEGPWLAYNEEGKLQDSANYVAGRLKGVRQQWHSNGMLADSTEFDGSGNGVEVTWYADGHISAAGYWVSDTLRKGRWKYYDDNGEVRATVDYVDGNRIACNCFDEAGQPLDTAACSEREASFPGGENAWNQFLGKNLKSYIPVDNHAPGGQYIVAFQYIIDTSGSVVQMKPLTHFGYGMEEEVERVMKLAPHWLPARQFGRKVKAYRRQTFTFAVSGG